jgi:hypothetical protein
MSEPMPTAGASGTDPVKQAALFAAIATATFRAKAIEKDATNTHHKYKYASAEAVIEEARVPLAGEGVCVIQTWDVLQRPDGGAWFADVLCTYLVAHKDGGWMSFTVPVPAIRGNGRPEDKAIAASLTYSLGYFLRGLIMLPRVDSSIDTDQRDDRDYDPRDQRHDQGGGNGQSGVGRLPSNGGQGNGQRSSSGNGSNGAKPAPPAPAPTAPPVDIGAVTLAMSRAATKPELDAAAKPLTGMEEGTAKEALRAVYRTRANEIDPPTAEATATPATPTPAAEDPGWAAGLAALAAVTGFSTDGWSMDDLLAEWHARLKEATDRKSVTAALGPWLQALKSKQGGSVKVSQVVTMMSTAFNERMKALKDVAPQQAAGGAA